MLAIVIPFYKLTFFEETLKSLVEQRNQQFNVYIGNDASPENPETLLNKYSLKLNIIYKKFETNLGSSSLVKQWDRCIDLIEDEEWIMILGDDDYLEKTVVESWYKHFNLFQNKSNVIRFSTISKNEMKNTFTEPSKHPTWENGIDSYYRRYKKEIRSTLSEYIFSFEVYNKYGIYDYPLAWHSDDRMWIDFSKDKKIFSINESKVIVRTSLINISGKTDNITLKNKASILFYCYLIKEKIVSLKNNQKLELLMTYETLIKKNRKLTFSEWKLLFNLYINNKKLLPIIKFFRRFLISFYRQ
ncbi:glycosyl transferase [Polaribacter sp. SA4-10]|uniref:glycosyltransferase n=1 Tax=Polaribacter sp. SA4-10 TaxID=754397 RepID=UPI000B3CB9BC|nr:glycosyltransferase [Polaribacter sp. SA4-10]ARV05497.1 glycosyl transferase [Polaribacter sp. SA4-10]